MNASTRVSNERKRAHNLLLELEGFVSDVECMLPLIEDALNGGVSTPAAKAALKRLQEKLAQLGESE